MGYSWSGFNCAPGRGAAAAGAEGDRLVLRLRRPLRRRRALPRRPGDPDGHGALVDLHARPGRRGRPIPRWSASAGGRCGCERLEQPPWIAHWLAHQRRDAYWEQGSVRGDYGQIECAVMCVAGWTDGYNDAALRLMEGLDVPRRALIGPWGHNDPVHGNARPGGRHPRASSCAGGIAGSKGIDNGIDARADGGRLDAGLRAARAPTWPQRPGRWVAEQPWPSPAVAPRTLALGDGMLGESAPAGGSRCASAASRPSASTAAPGAPTGARPTCRSTSAATTPARSPSPRRRWPSRSRSSASPRPGWSAVLRPAGGAGLGPAVRAARRRLVAAGDARPAQPLPSRLPCRTRRCSSRARSIQVSVQLGLDRPPVRGRQPHPALGLALLLAAGVAVARAGHARRCTSAGTAQLVLPARPAAGARTAPSRPPDPPAGAGAARHRARSRAARRRPHGHPRPRQRPRRARRSTGTAAA